MMSNIWRPQIIIIISPSITGAAGCQGNLADSVLAIMNIYIYTEVRIGFRSSTRRQNETYESPHINLQDLSKVVEKKQLVLSSEDDSCTQDQVKQAIIQVKRFLLYCTIATM